MLLTYVGDDPYICVTVITLSLGFNGASTVTNLQNAQDLAPNFAGTLYGTINFVGTTSGFITPLIVGHFTQDRVRIFRIKYDHGRRIAWYFTFAFSFLIQNTIDEWSVLFVIGAVAYIIPAIFFILFGSGNVQPWNEPPTKKLDDTPTTIIPTTQSIAPISITADQLPNIV